MLFPTSNPRTTPVQYYERVGFSIDHQSRNSNSAECYRRFTQHDAAGKRPPSLAGILSAAPCISQQYGVGVQQHTGLPTHQYRASQPEYGSPVTPAIAW